MLTKKDFAFVTRDAPADVVLYPELVAQPQRHRREVGLQPARCKTDIRLEQPVELDEGLLIKADQVNSTRRNVGFAKAVIDRFSRKTRVVLNATEAFFLSGGHDAALLNETGSGVVVIRRNAQDSRHLEQCVNERCDG